MDITDKIEKLIEGKKRHKQVNHIPHWSMDASNEIEKLIQGKKDEKKNYIPYHSMNITDETEKIIEVKKRRKELNRKMYYSMGSSNKNEKEIAGKQDQKKEIILHNGQ